MNRNMRRPSRPGLTAGLWGLVLGLTGWPVSLAATPRPSVEQDERADAYADKRIVVARVQSNLERVAAGDAPWPLPAGIAGDPLEAIVDAYARFVAGDVAGMDEALATVARETARRRPPPPSGQETDWRRQGAEATIRYFADLSPLAKAPPPLLRLMAGLRRVDGLLFLEAAAFYGVDFATRTVPMQDRPPSAIDGTWLRLPCRTVLGRAADFAETAEALGPHGGPLLACPAGPGTTPAQLEALAGDPRAFPPAAAADRGAAATADPLSSPMVAAVSDAAVNGRDGLGRTALMAAAAQNQPERAARLLAAGARINAATWSDGDPFRAMPAHDGRTALDYAAANASLAMIRLLLAAGADPRQADTKGCRAIDYLLGFGPARPNPRLSPEERAEAARLLF